jgi:hypothetical protein
MAIDSCDYIPTLPEGFVRAYVEHAIKRTDAPVEAHVLVAVCILSTLAGPRPRLPIATDVEGWPLVLWGMYLAPSTQARKSTVLGLARGVLEDVLGANALIHGEGSIQGILQRLADRDGQPTAFFRDEYSGLMAQMNRAGHLAGLPQLMNRAYDGKSLENARVRKRNAEGNKVDDTDRARRPYLTQIGAAAWDAFGERASIDNLLDGFLARFIFVRGKADPHPMPRLTPGLRAERERLADLARCFGSRARSLDVVEINDEALEAVWQLELEWMAEAKVAVHPDAVGPALKRLCDSVLKVAALLAIDQTPEDFAPVLTCGQFEAARRLAEPWKRDALSLIDALGETAFSRLREAVLATICQHPQGITRSELLRAHRHCRARDFEEIITTLEEREDIQHVEVAGGPGRKPLVYFPFGKAPGSDGWR